MKDEQKITPIWYGGFEEKKVLERKLFRAMTPEESLIHTLEVMDMMAALRGRRDEDDGIDWIVLKWKEKDDH